MDGTERVAHFVHEVRWDDLPVAVQRKTRMVFMDALASSLCGTLANIAGVAGRFAARVLPGNEATILATGRRSTAAGAAFANANTANAFDVDDVGQYTRGHPGAQIIPTALAVAEKHARSGKELLGALVAGYEVAHRAGRCWHDHHQEVYQSCGSWGSVANAATAAHLMRLEAPQIWHALGIAEYHSPNLPMMRDAAAPAMVKHGAGWAALTGILSAELAQAGFTGIPSLFSFDKYHDWVSDIGQEFIITGGAMFKEYALCGWSHACVDAIKLMKGRDGLRPEDIRHIRVETFYEAVLLGAKQPVNTEQAQYNTGWGMTMMLLDGEVGPRQLLEERLADPVAQALIARIEMVEAERFNEEALRAAMGDPDAGFACEMEVTLNDGRVLHSGRVEGGNKYSRQWNEARVEEKFRWLTGTVLDGTAVDRLVEMAWHFDQVRHMSELLELVSPVFRAGR